MKKSLILGLITVMLISGFLLDKTVVGNNALLESSIYVDVEKVYQHYFTDFNLTDLAEKQIKTELKMIANAVALERSNGGNFTPMLFISEQIAKRKIADESIRSEIRHVDDYIHPYKESENRKHLRVATSPSISSALQTGTNCHQFIAYMRDQEMLVEQFHLPYQINNSAIQVMDLRENRFLKAHPDKPDKMYDPNRISASQLAKRRSQLETFAWQPADILLGHTQTEDAQLSIQGYWNHAGIYNSQCHCIIDAWPEDLPGFAGGVRKSSWEFLSSYFSEIAIVRLNTVPLFVRELIEEHAAQRVGESYNLTTHKMNHEGGWYCSKLVYWAYLQESIDLDSRGGVSVLPDDIAMFDHLNKLECLTEE